MYETPCGAGTSIGGAAGGEVATFEERCGGIISWLSVLSVISVR
ncbi:MAG TPA: hypothetical protein PLM55_03610 [Chitinophagales bacterium]|nr:hypothetical protein [Chitinophagales bacterium]